MGQRGSVIPDWIKDKGWSDRFIPEIKRILGENLIISAPEEDDVERNTDLVVLKLDSVRIGCRVRKYHYVTEKDYKNEFTIRSIRPSGAKSELTKVIEGWGDYFFYGFSDEKEETLCAWVLCDLKVFRLWFNRQIIALKGKMPGSQNNNSDNSSSFIAFKINELPPEFIVARKMYVSKITNTSAP